MLYKAYGTIIRSDISFPQLVEEKEDREWEMEISMEEIPNTIKDYIMQHKGPAGKGEDYCWINTPGGYFIVQNNRIFMEKKTEEQLAKMRSYILGYGLSLLFHNRNQMAVHCSAIESNGKALLISGFSGAGKSTLAGAFLNLGYKLLADDVAMVGRRDGKVFTSPAFPVRKLCRDAALRNGYDLQELTYIDEDKDKFAVDCSEQFATKEAEVAAMVVVTPYDGDAVKLEEATGKDKIELFMKNQFLRIMFDKIGMEPQRFFECMQTLSVLPIYRIYRPLSNKDSAGEMTEKIQTLLFGGSLVK